MKDLSRKQYELLRIPKTGSESMKQAFSRAPTVMTHHGVEGHGVQLCDVPEHRTAIVAIRDPIDRFRSGYDMNARDNEAGIVKRYPTADRMVMALDEIMYDREWGYTYLPQVYWTHGAQYMLDREVIFVSTPNIDLFLHDFSREVPETLAIPAHANRQSQWGSKSTLSEASQVILRQVYRADYKMIDELRMSLDR